MIDGGSKYFCLSGDCPVGGPSTWHVTDWDQRRVISVTMDGEQDDETEAVEYLRRHGSQLHPHVYGIYVSQMGEVMSIYTDAKHDPTCCVHYPFLDEILLPEGIQIVRRDSLEELERLGPDADLVAYTPYSGRSTKKAVFKYHWHWQYGPRSWNEMNLWMRLPRHPNIVPFDQLVVDEVEGRVVGFTNDYMPDGTLEENKSRVIKLKWLHQLLRAVDDLNLQHGIAHQDVAPRNLVVDASTDSIMLFDFNFAARIKHPSPNEDEWYDENRNDVKGVIFTIYEIITRDESLRSVPHEQQNTDVLELEWLKHPEVKLDSPVAAYQQALQEWRERRVAHSRTVTTAEVPEAIDWPPRPKPPKKELSLRDIQGKPVSLTMDVWYEKRQDILDRGGRVLNWERPPQRVLDEGTRVLSNGEVADAQR